MRQHTCESVTSLQFNPAFFELYTQNQLQMLRAIENETESTRSELRNAPTWGVHIARGLKRQQETIADLLPWPALLTLPGCASKAARRAGSTTLEILEFALIICPYEHIVTLANHIAQINGIADVSKILSPLIQGFKAKETRIKQGASTGGKKSARTRQSNSKTPSNSKLLQERDHLLDSGRSVKDVAGVLAQRYSVDPSTIRRKLKTAKQQLL